MIAWLDIRNLALVDRAELEFGSGLNVITGETGAGKSVVMGAVSLLLGERAGKGVVGVHGDRCEISAGLALAGSPALGKVEGILEAAGVAMVPGEPLIIRRVVTASSSRNFLNDTSVTLATLKKLGDVLIDVHGAHEHQSLLSPSVQLDILDGYGALSGPLGKVRAAFDALSTARSELEMFEAELPSRSEEEELRSLVSEVDAVAPSPGEDVVLAERHRLASNARVIVETTDEISKALDTEAGGACAFESLSAARRGLVSLKKLGVDAANELLECCDELVESVRELGMDVERLASSVEMDEGEFLELEERIGALEKLKRKYGATLDEVLSAFDEASSRLDILENYEERRSELAEVAREAEAALESACAKLSKARRKAASALVSEATAGMAKLGLKDAAFAVEFSAATSSSRGSDKIDFMFSANPGVPPSPLRKVASSGEMSRVMLALKRILAEADDVPILVFDEIDVNIGGETAVVVGEELANLGKQRQLICISHLPAVAAAATVHFKIEKVVEEGKTKTLVEKLNRSARTAEIARMLGGGPAALRHAEEMTRG